MGLASFNKARREKEKAQDVKVEEPKEPKKKEK